MGMYGKGSSPRKQMAMGGAGDSLGDPSPYPGSAEHGRKMHPAATAITGPGKSSEPKEHMFAHGRPRTS